MTKEGLVDEDGEQVCATSLNVVDVISDESCSTPAEITFF